MKNELWFGIDDAERIALYDRLAKELGRGEGDWTVVRRHEFADGDVSVVYGYHPPLELAGAAIVGSNDFYDRVRDFILTELPEQATSGNPAVAVFTPWGTQLSCEGAIADAEREFHAMIEVIERFNEHCLAKL